MRVLFINTIQMFGGGEVWMLRTLTGLAQRGHDVFLQCRPGTELAGRAKRAGIPVFEIPVGGDLDPLAICKTARILSKYRIRIVLTNMDRELRFGGLAAKLTGKCAVIPRRGVDYPLKNRIRYRLSYNWLAHCVVANSLATKRALLRNAPWLKAKRIHVIYNGIDPIPFQNPAPSLRSVWSTDKNARFVGFVGQLDERKGIDCLLQAFSLTSETFQNAHLVFAGEGPFLRIIENYVKKHNLQDKVLLLGFRDDIEAVMKSIDMLVLPSLWEGFGIVLIEAMAAAKPVITTGVSSMPEIVIDGEVGRIIPVNDVRALSMAMDELLGDEQLAKRWGENGRKRVQSEFTATRMLDEYEKLFETVYAEKGLV
jgi:glycosyltransferase involved in cell wall biosynthesis